MTTCAPCGCELLQCYGLCQKSIAVEKPIFLEESLLCCVSAGSTNTRCMQLLSDCTCSSKEYQRAENSPMFFGTRIKFVLQMSTASNMPNGNFRPALCGIQLVGAYEGSKLEKS